MLVRDHGLSNVKRSAITNYMYGVSSIFQFQWDKFLDPSLIFELTILQVMRY